MSLLDYNETQMVKDIVKSTIKSSILSYYQQFVSKKIDIIYANIDGKDFDELTEEDWNRILEKADEYKVFFKYESHSWNLCIAIYPAYSNWSFRRSGFKGGTHTLNEFLSGKFNYSWMLNEIKQAMNI